MRLRWILCIRKKQDPIGNFFIRIWLISRINLQGGSLNSVFCVDLRICGLICCEFRHRVWGTCVFSSVRYYTIRIIRYEYLRVGDQNRIKQKKIQIKIIVRRCRYT